MAWDPQLVALTVVSGGGLRRTDFGIRRLEGVLMVPRVHTGPWHLIVYDVEGLRGWGVD